MTEDSRPESHAALLRSLGLALAKAVRGEVSIVQLAALVWASCTLVQRQGEVRQRPESKPTMVLGFEQARRRLEALGGEPEATEVYRCLHSLLTWLDSEVSPNTFTVEEDGLVELESLQPAPAVLKGTVQVWLQHDSLLRSSRRQIAGAAKSAADAGAGAVAGVEMKYLAEPDSSLRNLTFYLQSLERPRISFRPSSHEPDRDAWQPLVSDSALLAREGTLRIALCPLQGPWKPQFRIVVETSVDGGECPAFVALPRIKEESDQALMCHIASILEQAKRKQIHILIFPELSIDEHAREEFRDLLRRSPSPLLAVFAGSFHVGEPVPRNEAVVWDGSGRRLWVQRKRGRFRLDPWQMELAETREFFPDLLQAPTEAVWEGIVLGSDLVFADTLLGRLALLVCADALEPEANYLELIGRVHPDLVVILAMSPKTAHFEGARERLVKQGIGVLCVNAACVCRSGRRHLGEMVLVDLALHECDGLPPTRWRWRAGREPEWYQYGRPAERDPQKGISGGETKPQPEYVTPWRGLSELATPEGEEPAVALLDDEAGLMFNLGAYLKGVLGQNS